MEEMPRIRGPKGLKQNSYSKVQHALQDVIEFYRFSMILGDCPDIYR